MIRIVDSETGKVLIDSAGDEAENKDCIGTYTGPSVVHGAVYHGVKAWIAPRSRVYDWEPEGNAVFVQWVDESSSRADVDNCRLHTVERPLPGGLIYRFYVDAG